jgi:hypothetical protein
MHLKSSWLEISDLPARARRFALVRRKREIQLHSSVTAIKNGAAVVLSLETKSKLGGESSVTSGDAGSIKRQVNEQWGTCVGDEASFRQDPLLPILIGIRPHPFPQRSCP